ncbi:MAG: hypothetical protein HY749_21920 [Gammaproteobacteria bacterium]|nr:hypothetical protein [Gammaproteobacteria bacterium]MBI5615394.1 hypothetical protein [Gammaproteobacteria bacterium]
MDELGVLGRAFWGVCVLRTRPQDFPASRTLYLLLLGLYTVLNLAVQTFGPSALEALLSSLLESALLVALTRWLLGMRGLGARATQTLIALLGAGVVMTPPALALRLWFLTLERAQTHSELANALWIAFFVWNLFVTAHVLRHALEVRLFVGFSIALSYVMILLTTVVALHQAAFQTAT